MKRLVKLKKKKKKKNNLLFKRHFTKYQNPSDMCKKLRKTKGKKMKIKYI